MAAIRASDHLKLTVLVDNWAYAPPLRAEHGLSILLEVFRKDSVTKILYDAGRSGEVISFNASEVGAGLEDVSIVVLSHRHRGHTGGLSAIAESLDENFTVIGHPDTLRPSYVLEPRLEYVGPPSSSLSVMRDRLAGFRNPVEIAPSVVYLGEVDVREERERPVGYYTVEDGRLVEDRLMDDTGLAINLSDRGIVVLMGCAHSGIIGIVRKAVEATGVDRIAAIVGGFHLRGAPPERLAWTRDRLIKLNPGLIVPLHCTGFVARSMLLEYFRERVIEAGAGTMLRL